MTVQNFNGAAAPADDVKKKLDKPIGVIVEAFGLASPAQQEAAADLQAKLVALSAVKASLPADKQDLFKLNKADPDALVQVAGISQADLVAARQVVDAKKGVPQGVPPFGQVLMSLNVLGRDDKNALLQAQAAARTLLACDEMANGTVAPGALDDIAKLASNPMYTNMGKFADPASLTQAQSTQFATAMLKARVAAGLEAQPKFDGFKIAAVDSLRDAATKLNATQPQVAVELTTLADSYNKKPAVAAPAAKPATGTP